VNNVVGTLNLVCDAGKFPRVPPRQARDMGEYGTPNIDIEEGYITIEHTGARIPCRIQSNQAVCTISVKSTIVTISLCLPDLGLRATDLNQGGLWVLTEETGIDELLINRLDYDGVFGTALNRFCIQAAIAHPLTVYGLGGQTRGFWIFGIQCGVWN